MEKFLALPIVHPFVSLLHSRAFLVAVLTLTVKALIAQFPDLAPFQDPLTALGLALIGKMAIEDGAKNLKNGGVG